MSLTVGVLLACAIAYATKLVGYLVPARHLEHPLVNRLAATMTVGLLGALVATNTFVSKGALVADARIASLAAAAAALALRASFIVVVIVGAAAAALVRLLGWG